MTTSPHADLTGAELHEPKGVDAAASGTVYVADGAGSGAWATVGFSTGDIKPTIKTTADAGWVMLDDGTIGNGSSGASTRANADTSALFILLWTNISDTYATVSSGRGASAAADFAANKTIALPKALGRVLASAGAGSGLTSRELGDTIGEETHALTTAELATHSHVMTQFTGSGWSQENSVDTYGSVGYFPRATSSGGTNLTADAGSGTAHNNMQPTMFVKFMIKL